MKATTTPSSSPSTHTSPMPIPLTTLQLTHTQSAFSSEETPDPNPTSLPAQLEMNATSYSSTMKATPTPSSSPSTHTPPMPTPVTTLQPTTTSFPSGGHSGEPSNVVVGVISGVMGLAALTILVLGIFVMKRVYRAKNPKRRPAKARPLSALVHNMVLQDSPLQSPHLSALTAVLLPHTSTLISSQMRRV